MALVSATVPGYYDSGNGLWGLAMLTTTIRLTDSDGRLVDVPPEMIERVEQADRDLKDRVSPDSGFEYTGEWTFPGRDRAKLALSLKIPSDSVQVSFTFPKDTLANDWDRDWAVGRVYGTLLTAAENALQKRIDTRLHDLITTPPED